jgi:hypothetical protein
MATTALAGDACAVQALPAARLTLMRMVLLLMMAMLVETIMAVADVAAAASDAAAAAAVACVALRAAAFAPTSVLRRHHYCQCRCHLSRVRPSGVATAIA